MGSRSQGDRGRSPSARSSRKDGAASRRRSSSAGTVPSRGRGSGRRRVSARSVALDVVRRVTDHGAYSNLALRAALDRAGLEQRDADLASELTYGTLRRLPALDRAVGSHLRRPIDQAPSGARAALRLGAYQLLHMRIPDHAAATETVGLVAPSERGFVNAVLRKVAASPPTEPTGSTLDAVELRTGLAPWAIRELRGLLRNEAEAAAAGLAQRAAPTIRANPCRISVDELEAELERAGVTVE